MNKKQKKYFIISTATVLVLVLVYIFFFRESKPEREEILVKKPNIYFYPENDKTKLIVELDFPQGGKVVESIPKYQNGWTVSVDKNGTINNKFGYLFYESLQPDVWQRTSGYSISTDTVQQFFERNMSIYGFNQREILDFTEYWTPLLKKEKFLNVYPQDKKIINKVIKLKLSQQPKSIMRLFYLIESTNKIINIKQPTNIQKLERIGFTVVEWGVMNE